MNSPRGLRFRLNGRGVEVSAPPMKRLLDVLREECGLTGTKEGCGEGECGACTVLVDGEAVNSCLIPFAQARGTNVTTIEGLLGTHPLQETFITEGGAQCGICTPGMILAAAVLSKDATLQGVRVALAGNICRCTGYEGIYRAVKKAAGKKSPAGRATTRVAPTRSRGGPTGRFGAAPTRSRKGSTGDVRAAPTHSRRGPTGGVGAGLVPARPSPTPRRKTLED